MLTTLQTVWWFLTQIALGDAEVAMLPAQAWAPALHPQHLRKKPGYRLHHSPHNGGATRDPCGLLAGQPSQFSKLQVQWNTLSQQIRERVTEKGIQCWPVHLHTHARAHMHLHMHAHTHSYAHTHLHMDAHTYLHTHSSTHTCTHMPLHMHLHMHARAHTHAPTHIHLRTHPCTRTHTHSSAHTHRQIWVILAIILNNTTIQAPSWITALTTMLN